MKQLAVRLLQRNTGSKTQKNSKNSIKTAFTKTQQNSITKTQHKHSITAQSKTQHLNFFFFWLNTEFLQHFFCINIANNSHLFLVFQRLHFVKMLKIEKVIEICKCDLCRGTPCIYTGHAVHVAG